MRAEDVYTRLLVEDGSGVRPGARGTAICTVGGREFTGEWEVRQNAVWRRGTGLLRRRGFPLSRETLSLCNLLGRHFASSIVSSSHRITAGVPIR